MIFQVIYFWILVNNFWNEKLKKNIPMLNQCILCFYPLSLRFILNITYPECLIVIIVTSGQVRSITFTIVIMFLFYWIQPWQNSETPSCIFCPDSNAAPLCSGLRVQYVLGFNSKFMSSWSLMILPKVWKKITESTFT